jgi:hypothetical protein
MATRNDIFKNVQIGETFYWGGNTGVKLTERTAEIYMPLYQETETYFMSDYDNVTVG